MWLLEGPQQSWIALHKKGKGVKGTAAGGLESNAGKTEREGKGPGRKQAFLVIMMLEKALRRVCGIC